MKHPQAGTDRIMPGFLKAGKRVLSALFIVFLSGLVLSAGAGATHASPDGRQAPGGFAVGPPGQLRRPRRRGDENVRGPGDGRRRGQGRTGRAGQGLRRAQARRSDPRRRADALRHRLEHQGLHGHGARPARRGRQDRMGRPGHALSPLVPDVGPVRHPRDDRPRPPRPQERPRARRGRPAALAGDDLHAARDRRPPALHPAGHARSAAPTPTTTCSTSPRASSSRPSAG